MVNLSDINECVLENPCRNGATCINNAGSYQCICLPGFSGPHCVDGKCLCDRCRLICRFIIHPLERITDKIVTWESIRFYLFPEAEQIYRKP